MFFVFYNTFFNDLICTPDLKHLMMAFGGGGAEQGLVYYRDKTPKRLLRR